MEEGCVESEIGVQAVGYVPVILHICVHFVGSERFRYVPGLYGDVVEGVFLHRAFGKEGMIRI